MSLDLFFIHRKMSERLKRGWNAGLSFISFSCADLQLETDVILIVHQRPRHTYKPKDVVSCMNL